jgi:hypothetical protein
MKRFVTAGALVTAVLLTAVLLTAAQPAAASWLQKSTPVPSGASMWSFSAVSCPSGLFCMAVGATESRLLAETRVHDTWTEVSIPDPGGGQLAGVSCTSTSSCAAVGQFTSGGTTQTLAEAWNGSTWSIQATPNPSGATGSQLNGVSCRSASSCAAVGQFTSGGTTQTLAEAWNGSTWKIRHTPNASGADTSQLNGVSCPAATACEAVGVSQTGSAFSSLAEVWNGSTWKTQATPNRGGSSPSQLDAVSCTATNACTATGTGLAERWNGHAWALQTIAKARGQLPELAGVSCTASTRCLAVGDYFPEAIETQVSEQWDGTRWTVVDTSITTSADSSGLDSISCSSSTACAAAGFYHNSITGNKALAENWALRWQLQPPEVPSGALASDLHTVSCPVATFCAAVGGDELNGGVFDAVVETWNGKFWTVGTTPNASNSNLSGVSCNGAKVCTAVGDVAKGGSLKTLAERWNGTSWTVQSTPNPAGAVHSFLISVSCPSTKACIAVGFFTVGSGNQTPFAAHWNGTKWTLKTTPHPSGSTTSQLNAVSCTSSTACEAVGSDNAKTWAEKWNGTSWKIQSTPTPAGGRNALLDGVSCTAANACTAVGDFVNGSNKVVPLAERWNGTKWTVQGAAVPSGSVSELSSVSCSLVSRCVAVGSVTKSGVSLPLGEFWNGTTWTVDPAQSPDLNVTRSTMSSVSCGTSLTCMGVGFYDTSGGVDAPVGEQFS